MKPRVYSKFITKSTQKIILFVKIVHYLFFTFMFTKKLIILVSLHLTSGGWGRESCTFIKHEIRSHCWTCRGRFTTTGTGWSFHFCNCRRYDWCLHNLINSFLLALFSIRHGWEIRRLEIQPQIILACTPSCDIFNLVPPYNNQLNFWGYLIILKFLLGGLAPLTVLIAEAVLVSLLLLMSLILFCDKII